jgi:predicted nucleic acid-binding protein
VIAVSDTSPITNLAAIGQIDLLRQLYQTLIIPKAVYYEMVLTEKSVPGAIEVQTYDWIQTQPVADVETVALLQAATNRIHLGEAEVIALGLEVKADVLLMDERRGRRLAQSLGLKVIGILGILLLARQNHLLIEAKPLLDRMMQESDFRVSARLYKAFLQAVDEL